jgi:hypothetical protein
MNVNEMTAITHDEISFFAFLNWQKDGCPSGRDLEYWLEAEHQLRATRHLLLDENNSQPNGKTLPRKSAPRLKAKAATPGHRA